MNRKKKEFVRACLSGFLFFGVFLLVVSQAMAAQITVSWDPSPDSDVVGYKLYFGTSSRNYTNSVDVGNTTSFTLTNLEAGKIYYIAATAYDTEGLESDFSEEVVATAISVDSDGDGIADDEETSLYKTDPFNADTDGDGISDGNEVARGTDPLVANSPNGTGTQNSLVMLDVGFAQFKNSWTTISLNASFHNPVVLIGPATYYGKQPGIVRINNVGSDSFDVAFNEWEYLDGKHKREKAAYLVMDEGRYVLDDGSIWEVGIVTLSGNGDWHYVAFTDEFPDAPKVFLTIQTHNDSTPVIVRARNVDSNGFEAALFHEEANGQPHGTEIVGYIAVWNPDGTGTIAGIPYAVGSAIVDSDWSQVGDFQLMLQEETSADSETYHLEELVDVLVVGEQVFAQDVWWVDFDPASLRVKY